MQYEPKPVHRSRLRLSLGMRYYGLRRRLQWLRTRRTLAQTRSGDPLPYLCFSHRTVLRRKLQGVEPWLQENKIINLRLATARLQGLLLRPGETFSYWYSIGKPTRRKGYVDGMILQNGDFLPGLGGGLCQLSNLIFWMTLHSPLTVVERHRHAYDVFPDAQRTQPFGSGATCFYPHGDLMIRNDTDRVFQLQLEVGKKDLIGAWRTDAPMTVSYRVEERDHAMRQESWGGYIRSNTLWQQTFDSDGTFLEERLAVRNAAIMMYRPFLESAAPEGGAAKDRSAAAGKETARDGAE